MERRIGPRGSSQFEVFAHTGWGTERLRGIAISTSGLVVERSRRSSTRLVIALELELPERSRRVALKARSVREFAGREAFRFVEISDVDRLNVAEHLDVLHCLGRLSFASAAPFSPPAVPFSALPPWSGRAVPPGGLS